MEHMYDEAGEEQMPHGGADGEDNKNKHKEEGEGRRLDEADRRKIAVTPSMASNQVSITSAMAKCHQTE